MIETVSKNSLDRDTLEEALTQFRGAIEQIPPMYSALKRDGRRLYQLAREGKEVPRDPRTVNIFELEVDNYDPCSPELRVRCSKGTYIRTLIEDIAEAVGSVGHVSKLRRVAVYPFQECQMVSLESLEAAAEIGMPDLDAHLMPVDDAIADWPAVHLAEQEAYYLRHGHPVTGERCAEVGLVRLYDQNECFMGIGETLPDGRVAPRRRRAGRDSCGARPLSQDFIGSAGQTAPVGLSQPKASVSSETPPKQSCSQTQQRVGAGHMGNQPSQRA